MTRILFVCLGNICRSPTAEAVFRARAGDAGLLDRLELDSAGTGDWHVGKAPDRRAVAAAALRGYDLSPLRARQVEQADFSRFDLILAMDEQNLADLEHRCPDTASCRLGLFLDYLPTSPLSEVPDPYYGGDDGFRQVLDLIEGASDGLIKALEQG